MKIYNNYSVSEDGTVINTNTGRILKAEITKYGYRRITLCFRGNKERWLLHRLVAALYIPNPDNKPCVNHIDGDKGNNHVDNLEWVTHAENEQHSVDVLGKRSPSGKRHYAWKLSEEVVSEMKRLRYVEGISCHAIAKMFGENHQLVSVATRR